MSRKTHAAKALALAATLAGSVLGLAGSAQAADPAITAVGPAKASTTAAATMTIKGTGFTSAIQSIVFNEKSVTTSLYTCKATPIVVSASLMYVTKPASGCANGVQKVEMHNVAAPTAATSLVGTAFNPTLATATTTFATPTTIASVSPTAGSVFGGTVVTVTVGSTVSTPALTATLGGKPLASIKVTGATTFTGIVPAGTSAATADLVVTTNGVPSAANTSFSYKQALKVSPAFAPLATPGEIVITGVGLKPSGGTVAVTVCGAAATPVAVSTTKPYTDVKMYVTAPTAAAVVAAGKTGFATSGGACDVKVTIDANGATADAVGQVNPASVLTAGSTFTYAAY